MEATQTSEARRFTDAEKAEARQIIIERPFPHAQNAEIVHNKLKSKFGSDWINAGSEAVKTGSEAYYLWCTIQELMTQEDLVSFSRFLANPIVSKNFDRSIRGGAGRLLEKLSDSIPAENKPKIIENLKTVVNNYCEEATRQGYRSNDNTFLFWKEDIYNYTKIILELDNQQSEYIHEIGVKYPEIFDSDLTPQIEDLLEKALNRENIKREYYHNRDFRFDTIDDETDSNNSDYHYPDFDTENSEGGEIFKSHGLTVRKLDEEGKIVLYIDFLPFGNGHFTGEITIPLAYGFLGFKEFIDFLDNNPEDLGIENDTKINGYTNSRMALAAQKLGFEIDDPYIQAHSLKDNLELDGVSVSSTVDKIRKALESVENKYFRGDKATSLVKKIMQRIERNEQNLRNGSGDLNPI